MLRAVGQGPWAGSLCWDRVGLPPDGVCPGPPPRQVGGVGRLWSRTDRLGQLSVVPPWRADFLLSLSFLVCGGAMHPPGALSGLRACAGGGRAASWNGPRMGRMGLTIVPESVPGSPICP